jgi:hypothetical protein
VATAGSGDADGLGVGSLDADEEGVGEADAPAEGLPLAEALALGDADGLVLGDGDALGWAEALGDADAVTPGDSLGRTIARLTAPWVSDRNVARMLIATGISTARWRSSRGRKAMSARKSAGRNAERNAVPMPVRAGGCGEAVLALAGAGWASAGSAGGSPVARAAASARCRRRASARSVRLARANRCSFFGAMAV